MIMNFINILISLTLYFDLNKNELGEKYNFLIDKYNVLLNQSNCKLYDAKNNYYERVIPNGIFFPETDFYCVWIKNRYLSEIEETDRHEHCHYLVENNYYHFCEEYNYLKDVSSKKFCD